MSGVFLQLMAHHQGGGGWHSGRGSEGSSRVAMRSLSRGQVLFVARVAPRVARFALLVSLRGYSCPQFHLSVLQKNPGTQIRPRLAIRPKGRMPN